MVVPPEAKYLVHQSLSPSSSSSPPKNAAAFFFKCPTPLEAKSEPLEALAFNCAMPFLETSEALEAIPEESIREILSHPACGETGVVGVAVAIVLVLVEVLGLVLGGVLAEIFSVDDPGASIKEK